MDVYHSQLGTKVLEDSWGQGFSENIRELQGGRNWKKLYEARSDFVTNKMAIDLNMLGAFVEYGICCYLNCGLIVTVQSCWLNECCSKILKKICQPLYLTGGGCKSSILSFGGAAGDSGLLL